MSQEEHIIYMKKKLFQFVTRSKSYATQTKNYPAQPTIKNHKNLKQDFEKLATHSKCMFFLST